MEIWLELGLQTAHAETLKRINRGHGFDQYADTVKRARALRIKVCTHLILGLPGETPAHSRETMVRMLGEGVDGVKLHPLHVVDGSIMAKQWRAARLDLWDMNTYVNTAADLIRMTPAEVVFHRVTAYARPPELLAPSWCADKWLAMNAIVDNLITNGGQGSASRHPYPAHQSLSNAKRF
jgi:radical SAM protein (TIGR01212 family)